METASRTITGTPVDGRLRQAPLGHAASHVLHAIVESQTGKNGHMTVAEQLRPSKGESAFMHGRLISGL
jgi:hypothetical protein